MNDKIYICHFEWLKKCPSVCTKLTPSGHNGVHRFQQQSFHLVIISCKTWRNCYIHPPHNVICILSWRFFKHNAMTNDLMFSLGRTPMVSPPKRVTMLTILITLTQSPEPGKSAAPSFLPPTPRTQNIKTQYVKRQSFKDVCILVSRACHTEIFFATWCTVHSYLKHIRTTTKPWKFQNIINSTSLSHCFCLYVQVY